MARYIDADALNETLKARAEGVFGSSLGGFTLACAITHVMKIIKEFPTADVEEVRHGEWGTRIDKEDFPLTHNYRVCSVCDTWIENVFMAACCAFAEDTDTEFLYCPNCGAKMDA